MKLFVLLAFLFFSEFQPPEVKELPFKDKSFKKVLTPHLPNSFGEHEKFTFFELSSKEDIAESGNGSTCILFIYDENESPLGAIKAIPLDGATSHTFTHEVDALTYFSSLPLSQFHSVKALDSFEIDVDGKSFGIIVEEVAKGKSINQLIKEVSINPTFETLSALKKALKKTGKALYELHNYKNYLSPDASYLKRYESDTIPGPFSLIHGDAHPGNIFYSEEIDEVTFIDFASADASRSGGPSTLDLANFLTTLEILTTYYNVPNDTLLELKAAFLSDYLAPIDENALTFYTKVLLEEYLAMPKHVLDTSKQGIFLQKFATAHLQDLQGQSLQES